MKRAAIGVWALGLIALLVLAIPAAAEIEIAGLKHLDGSSVAANEVAGNALFIVFSSWSPKCRDIVERANEVEADWGDKARVFLVNFQEDAETVEEFLDGQELNVEVLLDPDASFSKQHQITYLPSLLAVKNGSAAFRGKLPSDTKPVLRPILE